MIGSEDKLSGFAITDGTRMSCRPHNALSRSLTVYIVLQTDDRGSIEDSEGLRIAMYYTSH